MAAIGKLRIAEDGLLMFYCPGCRCSHGVPAEGVPNSYGAAWKFNGNFQSPTFEPSILVKGTQSLTDEEVDRIMAGEANVAKPFVCHSYVRNGRIEYLGDCTHALAGTTVDMEEAD